MRELIFVLIAWTFIVNYVNSGENYVNTIPVLKEPPHEKSPKPTA